MSSSSERTLVRTVQGDIPAHELGHTQCHEHVFLEKGPSYDIDSALCMNDSVRSLKELGEYKVAGGRTIVDAQPVFCGRNAEVLLELSQKSKVNIVAVTGFHKKIFIENDAPYRESNEEKIANLYAKEITEGMLTRDGGRSSAKAGMVKVAFEPGGLEDTFYGKMFSAAAEAAVRTGAPILVHTEKNTDIFELIGYFERAGIKADRLLVCHLDRTKYDIGYHKEVLSTGCRLCYDSINRLKYVKETEELELISAMCSSGYIKQLVLSLDTTNKRLRSYYAEDMGLDYILKTYIPIMQAYGFSDDDIKYMCVINAQDALSLKLGELL